jgi:hypothetical protein
MNNCFWKASTLALIVALSACKTTGTGANDEKISTGSERISGTQATPASVIGPSQRAEDRWNHIINKRFDEAYDMFSPGYRQSMSREDYVNTIKNRPLKWTEAKAVDEACASPQSCKVKIKIKFSLTMVGAGEVNSEDQIYEDWLQVNGNWYFLPKTMQTQ